eukprot:CAMPEP_0194031380 /NCGR_PEP_ID=MMETSP0009_2-20130614/4562_1 /TAXON_ID=210454 /ORGANISM="Grammatophora oceanica, Strain CCMP 410" /LENGTH=610 /DNA_ID=CAMNT_0038671521 /DNA_START=225 /DNA_END=2057 /DNA_ORIENTATION=-
MDYQQLTYELESIVSIKGNVTAPSASVALLRNKRSKQQEIRDTEQPFSNGRTKGADGPLSSSSKSNQNSKPSRSNQNSKPNVLFLMCDDLNDYIETLGGHPQAITPNIRRLMETSVSFTQAHANIPLCKPSRASFLSGLYPHSSNFVNPDDLPRPEEYEGLKHQRTLVEHFNENGYRTLGTGKIYHGYKKSYWMEVGHEADYGPFVYNKTEAKDVHDTSVQNLPHPAVPARFGKHEPVRGSFGPLEKLDDPDLGWRTGGFYKGFREIQVHNATHRDMTPDEQSADWAVKRLRQMNAAAAQGNGPSQPFFLGVGLVRPHHPMIVSQKYFDMYPIESLQLPPSFLDNDANDTMRQTLAKAGIGQRMYQDLVKGFHGRKSLLRYIQAYLASVTAADELLGKVLDALDQTRFKDNTIVVFTSDHGYQAGQKGYLGKNLLWQATTRVPLVVRVPNVGSSSRGRKCSHPVSLVDLYPTLIDLCGLSNKTENNEFSRPLDGHSLRPFLSEAPSVSWSGPKFALSTLSQERNLSDPIGLSLSARYNKWRYIRYSNGKEELYNTVEDPYEWANVLVANQSSATSTAHHNDMNAVLNRFRNDLFQFVGGDDRRIAVQRIT